MVEFETIDLAEQKFGKKNFMEIALKKARGDETETLFVSVSRGFITKTEDKKYTKSIAIPIDKELIDFVSTKIKEMGEKAMELSPQEEAPQEEVKETTEESNE